MQTDKRILQIIIFCILLVYECSPKPKKKGIVDEGWRQESLKISASICKKFQECNSLLAEKINPSLKKLFSSEIREDKCSEKNKKSNIYELRGGDPEHIKSVTRKCAALIQSAPCQDIENKSFLQNPDCMEMRNLQRD